MSLTAECGWTLLRSVSVALLAWPVCTILARVTLSTSKRFSRLTIASLMVPFLTPGFLAGYAYSNITLSLARYPTCNELFYDLLLTLQLVPLGTLVLICSPPVPISPSANHCIRLAGRRRLKRFRGTGRFALCLRGPLRNHLPALAVMSLLAFHEFEIASLFRVIAGQRLVPVSWANALFEAAALQGLGEDNPQALLNRSWLPLTCSLLLLSPLLLLLGRRGHQGLATTPVPRARPTVITHCLALSWLVLALLVLTIVPLVSICVDSGSEVVSFLGDRHRLSRLLGDIGSSLGMALEASILAALVATILLRRGRTVALGIVSLPGLLGNLSLGLLLTYLLLQPALRSVHNTGGVLLLGQVLWLLPRATLLLLLLAVTRTTPRDHTTRLLQVSPRASQRHAGWRLSWELRHRSIAVMLALLCWWSYLELTLNELLAPPELLSIAHLVYQQMHFGRNGALSATTLLIIVVPILVVLATLLVLHLAPGLSAATRRHHTRDNLTETST